MSPRWHLLVSLAAGVASAATAAAQELGIEDDESRNSLTRLWEEMRGSGLGRVDYFTSSKALDSASGLLGATFQSKVLPNLTDNIDGKIELRATNSAVDGGGDSKARFLEAYLAVDFGKADLYLGKQIVAWGRADGINPTDNLTPRDYTVLLPFEEDQRFGTTAARLDVYSSDEHTVTVFATPFFEPSEVPLPTAGRTVIEIEPANTLSNTEIGLKLNKVGEGFDWSASYFRGFSLFPSARFIDSSVGEPALELHYDRVTVLGADVAHNYGRFGFRAEIAYVDTTDAVGIDPSVRNSYLYWIAGVDRTFYENLNVNLQFFQRRIRHHHDPETIGDPLERTTALVNAVFDGQRDRLSDGISFRVSNQWFNNTLEAEIFAVVNFTRSNSFWRPLVTYAFDDHWSATIGAELYRGADDTPYGSLKRNRTAFVELRYGF